MKKLIALVCCSMLVASSMMAVGCGGGGSDDTKTKIYVEIKNGGTGVQWLVNAGRRFADLVAETEYEPGKKGVAIVPVPNEGPSVKNATTSGTAIFDLMSYATVENDARAGKILCIDDVITEKSDTRNGLPISPLDKISEDQRSRYMYNGHYYGGPTCEYYPTISYDKNLFDNYGLYFASPEAIEDYEGTIVEHESKILEDTYYFLPKKGNSSWKSCGPDGIYGTEDDGLASSLYELIALCEYMKGQDIHPFNFTGNYKFYSNFLPSAIYTALQGYDNAMGNYNFEGEIEIVTGFEDDYLFPGDTNIKKPITKTVTLSEENGYYTTWELEKYYAEAFVQLCISESWFGPSATNGDDQKAAMSKFVFSDYQGSPKIAMLLDGSYWYNEATEGDNYFQMLEDQKYLTASQGDPRDVRIMPLPVNIKETVEEGEGKPQTLLEMNYGMFVLNKNLEEKPGLMQAAKDFLKFMYTDAELSAYTASTSILRSMNYELSSDDAEKISTFGKHLIDMVNTRGNEIVYFAASNKTFNAGTASFAQSWTNAVFTVNGVSTNLYEALAIIKKDGYKTVHDIFAKQAFTKEQWQNMYAGEGTVTDVDGLVKIDN